MYHGLCKVVIIAVSMLALHDLAPVSIVSIWVIYKHRAFHPSLIWILFGGNAGSSQLFARLIDVFATECNVAKAIFLLVPSPVPQEEK